MVKQIDAGALNVRYDDAGPPDGPAVVLLHGSSDIHSYGGVTPQLAAAGYRVIVPYLRGYGMTSFLSSRAPRSGDQVVFAVDAIALLDALKIPRRLSGVRAYHYDRQRLRWRCERRRGLSK